MILVSHNTGSNDVDEPSPLSGNLFPWLFNDRDDKED